MDNLDRQSLDSPISPGSPSGVEPTPSSSLIGNSTSENESGEGGSVGPGGSGSSTEECYRAHFKLGFLQPFIRSPQERGWLAPNNKPQAVEFLPRGQSFQDGRDQYSQRCAAKERLDGKVRSFRCLSDCSHPHQGQEVPKVSMEEQVLPVQKPSLWPCNCATNLYQVDETHNNRDAQYGCEIDCLFRRYLDFSPVTRGSKDTHENDGAKAGIIRLQTQRREVRMGTLSAYRVSRVPSEFPFHEDLSPGKQGEEDPGGVQSSPEEEMGDIEAVGTADRYNDSFHSGRYSGSSPLPGSSEVAQQVIDWQQLRSRGKVGQGLATRSTVVDRPTAVSQWQTSCNPSGRCCNYLGCIKDRMGSNIPRYVCRRSMEQGREKSSHQLAGAKGRFPSLEDLCLKGVKHPCAAPNRQHHSNLLHQPQRRHSFQEIVRLGHRDLDVVHTKEYYPLRRAYSWSGQCGSRSGIQETDGFSRVDVEQNNFQQNPQEVGSSRSGPVCGQTQPSAAEVLQLRTGSRSRGSGCPGSVMEGHSNLCISSIQPSWEMPEENQTGENPIGSANSPCLARPVLVSDNVGEHSGSSDITPTLPSNLGESGRRSTSSSEEQQSEISRLEGVRRSMQNEGISEEAFKIMCSSWRVSTEKSYSSAWRKWLGWCHERKLDPFPTSVKSVVDFLSFQFQQGRQYSTINSYRSALSATIPPIDGQPVGQHPLVCKLLQGMFNKRPPMPRYQTTWDVGLVIQCLKSLSPTEDQPLQVLSKKLVTLLALANASRASDIHALDLQFHKFSGEGVLFHIPSLTKTRRSGPPKTTFIAKFEEDPSICPVRTLQIYIEKTKDLRKAEESGRLPLLISFKKPHKAVSSATISRWMKQLLSEAGVPTEMFKAHSVRAASSSAAKNKGVSMADIMHAAGWNRSSTFEKFYYKPIDGSAFTKAVLQE